MSNKITLRELGVPDRIPRPKRSDWRIGLVGFGGIAGAHVPAYREAGWQIVAVADPSPEARQRARDSIPGVCLYEDYHDLVADANVEVVSLLTQPTLRVPVVEAAFNAGKPMLTEKPLATNIKDCERMAALSEEYGLPLAVSQNYRWNGANFFARQIIKNGLIGTPFYAAIEIQGRQDVELADHPFYSQCEDFLTVQWNNHLADLMRYWFDKDPLRVLACTRRMKGQEFKSDNLLFSIADYGEGTTGHIVHSELLRSRLGFSRCRVDGDAGSILFDLYGTELTIHSRQTGDEPRELDLGGRPWASSFSGPMGDLLISIEEGKEPATSVRRNLPTMRHVMAEERSAKAGGVWITI
jgi:predicted dehydrogenase